VRHLGAAKVIATGRNETELASLGADAVIPIGGDYERALISELSHGIDVVLDYLWGKTARTVMIAIARSIEDAHPVRFVHIGGASGEESIDLPGAALRSSAIQLMGSGAKSVPYSRLLDAVRSVFTIAVPEKLQIETKTVSLSAIADAWNAPGKPRVVVTMK